MKNRRATDDEDRASWREYLKIYSERLKMELDVLPVLQKAVERIEAAVNRQGAVIYGNGDPAAGLCYRVAATEKEIKTLNDRINGLFKTDDWRKDFLAGAIRSVATAVIAAGIIYYLKK